MAKRKTFGNTWWGKQWLDALTDIDNTNRLPRGRAYCTGGHIISCEWIAPERCILALVSGSAYFPYEVRISLPRWAPDKEKALLDAIAADPALVAELLQGTLPPAVAEICQSLNLELFPRSWRQMSTSCSCPDSARICKHIAAVFYALADAIDTNPFLIFQLHGLDLAAELKTRGIDTQAVTSARPLLFSELARAALEDLPTPPVLTSDQALEALRTLSYGTFPSMKTPFLELLPDSFPLPSEDDFLDEMRQLLTALERTYRSCAPMTDETAWFEEHILSGSPGRRYRTDENTVRSLKLTIKARATDNAEFSAVLRARFSDTDSKERRIELKERGAVFAALLRMPASLAREAAPETECWREITQSAARLLAGTVVVPALIQPEGRPAAMPRIVWTPAVRNAAAASLTDRLTQACGPFAGRLFEACAAQEGPDNALQTVFLALTLAASSLVQNLPFKGVPRSFIVLLAIQAEADPQDEIEPAMLRLMLSTLNAFLLGTSYPWRPTLTATVHRDGIKVNFGIIGRASRTKGKESPGGFGTKRPVLLSRILGEERYANERFAVLSTLKTLAQACPLLKPIAESGRPVTIERLELRHFLFDIAPMLTLLGVSVMLPESLRRLLRPRLTASVGVNPGKSLLGKDAFTDFDWKVAVGDLELTTKELRDLMQHAGEIVRMGENFVYLDPNELARLSRAVDDQPQPTYLEKMRAALSGEYEYVNMAVEMRVSTEILDRLNAITKVSDAPPPEGLKAVLRPYQARGYAWLMKNLHLGLGSLIADDMGLGKTLQVISALLQLKNERAFAKHKALVVVPATLMTNWSREIARFAPSPTVGLYHGAERSLPARAADLPDVTITTYGLMRRDAEILSQHRWRLLVLDEAQAIKNAASGQALAARAVRTEQTIAMTGTPVENHLVEYWSILETVQPKLLGSLKDFTRTFASPIENDRSEEAAAAFRRLTAPFMLRRLKSDKSVISDLPERTTVDRFTTLTAEQAALYSKVLEAHMKKLASLDEKAAESDAADAAEVRTARRGHVLSLITRIKQICNSPSQYLKTEAPVPDSGKAAALFEILEQCRDSGRKVLVFTQYREMGERLQNWIARLTGSRPDFLHGGVPLKERQAMVDSFQNDRSVHVMIVSLKAGGTGLNLTAASCVVHYDLWWNPAVEAQATDRSYRIGQRRDVLVYRFVTAGTFEERINDMLAGKRELADLTVASGETWIGDMPTAELQKLFALDASGIES